MKLRTGTLAVVVLAIILLVILTGAGFAQATNGTIRGRVTDPTGAVVPQTAISVTGADGQSITAATKADGTYEVKDLPPGKYTVRAQAKGFTPFEQVDVEVAAGQVRMVDVSFTIEVEKQEINVEDQATNVNVDPASNAGAIVLKGKDLEALSDDPDQLQADLEALAGPAAGPNGGQIYIDGFSNGQLPPKAAIREVRINQNPFSAEFDHIGFGRIEIFTKPGQDKFRGSFMTNLNNSALNSRNPFVPASQSPGYHSQQFSGNFSGPISRKSSFFFNAERRDINDSSIVNAMVLDSNFNQVPFQQAILHPMMRMSIGPRLDYQLGKNDTLTARYHLNRSTSSNDGIQLLTLPSQAGSRESVSQELQVSETHLISNYTVNETRAEYERDRSRRSVLNFDPTISVADAFTGGGNSGGNSTTHDDNLELQNLTIQTRGTHVMKWGGRLRFERQALASNSGYNGTFSFANLDAYQLVQQGLAQGLTTAEIRANCVAALGANPKATDLLNCGPNQFSLTAGIPAISISQTDLGLFFSDDWRVRSNLTLSYGLRVETQNNISDHADIAPRLAFAWGIGRGKSVPKTVLRAGAGIFYDRFRMDNVLTTRQLDGTHQLRFVITPDPSNPATVYPDFYPNIPTLAELQAFQAVQSVYAVTPSLRTPYIVQAAVTVERQVTKTSTVAVNYIASRGLHQIATFNINAPLGGVTPDPTAGPIYQYQDAGIFKQQQLMFIPNIRISSTVSLTSFYTLSWANGTPGTPSNPYNLIADYGRSAFDVRQRFMIMGTISLPHGFRLNPNIMASSGRPFNITIGQDLNNDSFFNDRPSLADPNNLDPNYTRYVVQTRWGLFYTNPAPDEERIPINYGTGPKQFSVGLRVSKTFAIGKRAEIARGGPQGGPGGDRPGMMAGGRGPGGGGDYHGPDHGPGGGGGPRGGGGFAGPMMRGGGPGGSAGGRYSLTVSADARNLLNNVNYGQPIGNLTAGARFGTYRDIMGAGFGGTSANRRISFQAMFSF